MKTFHPILIALSLVSSQVLAQDVKLYEKAPSVDELERQLTGGGTQTGKKKIRTRAIVFGDAPSAAPQQEQVAPAPMPAATIPAAPSVAGSVPVVSKAAAPAPVVPQVAVSAPVPTTVAAVPQQAQQPAQAAASQQQPMQVSELAIAFPINFRANSADVMPESVPFIESIAGLLRKDPELRILIEGHTDSSGSAARNTVLSRERAFSIMNYLVDRYRVAPTRLVPVGRGFSEPLGGTDPTNPKNRRVQFRIIG